MLLKTQEITIRDPYIYADPTSSTYFMYAQSGNRKDSAFIGVEAYASKDLVHWQRPQPVLSLPAEMDVPRGMVWAPEMHAWRGRYYLLVTLTRRTLLSTEKPVKRADWPDLTMRGTYIFQADHPLGPFTPLKDGSHTPADWMALDGTLFVEEDRPYMVFCHEWIQVVDGTMDCIRLKDDLSDTIGTPSLLFRASNAPDALPGQDHGKVTDGCFLYRSPVSRRLFMIWSTFITGNRYCIVLARSESGSVQGPWIQQRVLYPHDGGHGMLFHSFDGRLLLAFHQPNGGAPERLHLFEITDDGETMSVRGEVNLREV